ncbi:membrane-associated protein, putative [Bodo saltans]|uniref:Membrane-associated protein, putative n=1 Tax=Bodo saltans TaxID=75058 RepID=A0A0S4ISM6_BODSA|nr:membrane-associated protein, putative [Bodo saltans]|eukprot:CUF03526.1 membrane-associated protein, putative [Bodo saltans]
MHLFSALDALFLGGIVALYIITPGDGTSVIGSDSFMWVATMFLISGLRDRSVYVLVSSLSEILVAAAFLVAMNVRSSSRSLAGIEEVVAVCSCICCLAFRWSSDASRRHFFANDEELRRVEKISTEENIQLTELLFQMIPVTKETTKGQMFGRLLELVRAGEEDRHLKSRKQIDEGPAAPAVVANDEEQFSWQLFGQCSNLRSATLSSLDVEEERRHQRSAQAVRDVLLTAPRHFGLRGSVFATRVMDKPFLVIRVHNDTPTLQALPRALSTAADTSTTSSGGATATSHQTRTHLSHRRSSSTTSEGGVPPHNWLQATDECMRRITNAVNEVPHAALVKTNGDVVVVAVETTGASIDRECVLLMAVAAALARKKKAVPASHPNDSSSPKLKRNAFVLSEEQSTLLLATSMRCLLTAGPAVGGVLGTAALTFEYFGEPLETAQRLLSAHQNDSFLWPRTAAPLADAVDTPCSFTDTDRDDVAVHIVATQRFSKWFLTGLDAPPTLPTASNTLSAIVFPKVVARLKIGDSIEAAGAPRYFLQAAMDLEQRGFLASLSVVTQTFIMMSAPPTHVEDEKKSSGLKSPPHQQPSTTDGNQDAIILHTQRYSIVVGCVFSHSLGSEVGDNATVHAAMKGPTKRHHRAPLSSVSLHRIFIRDDEVQYPQ